MHINLNAHSQVKIWNPTPECPNQIYPPLEVFHGLFTSFSRPFHEFFTAFSHFWVLRCFCIFSWQLPQKQWRHDFQTTKNNFISSKYRTGTLNLQRPSFKPVAPWQVAGNSFFYSYFIGGNVEEDQYLRLAALRFVTQSWCWWEVLAILR